MQTANEIGKALLFVWELSTGTYSDVLAKWGFTPIRQHESEVNHILRTVGQMAIWAFVLPLILLGIAVLGGKGWLIASVGIVAFFLAGWFFFLVSPVGIIIDELTDRNRPFKKGFVLLVFNILLAEGGIALILATVEALGDIRLEMFPFIILSGLCLFVLTYTGIEGFGCIVKPLAIIVLLACLSVGIFPKTRDATPGRLERLDSLLSGESSTSSKAEPTQWELCWQKPPEMQGRNPQERRRCFPAQIQRDDSAAFVFVITYNHQGKKHKAIFEIDRLSGAERGKWSQLDPLDGGTWYLNPSGNGYSGGITSSETAGRDANLTLFPVY